MLIEVQHVNRASPAGFVGMEAGDWATISPGEQINQVSCQGHTQKGADKYHATMDGSAAVLTMIHDDPSDWPEGMKWAEVIRIEPLAADADPLWNGAIRPRHTKTRYAQADAAAALAGSPVPVLPWEDFTEPPDTREGVWLTDEEYAAHRAIATPKGWREWTDGVPAAEVVNGKVRDQRARGAYVVPDGTRTYFVTSTTEATGVHSAKEELQTLATAPGAPTNINIGGIGTNGAEAICTQSPSGEPNQLGAWGLITTRFQADITAMDSTLELNCTDLGTASGHFARVDSGLTTEIESFQASSANITAPGLHIIEVTATWVQTGAQTDRFEVLLCAQKVFGHGNDQFTYQADETDDFIDGGWPSAILTAQAAIAIAAAVGLPASAVIISTIAPELSFDCEVQTSHAFGCEVETGHEFEGGVATSHSFEGKIDG